MNIVQYGSTYLAWRFFFNAVSSHLCIKTLVDTTLHNNKKGNPSTYVESEHY